MQFTTVEAPVLIDYTHGDRHGAAVGGKGAASGPAADPPAREDGGHDAVSGLEAELAGVIDVFVEGSRLAGLDDAALVDAIVGYQRELARVSAWQSRAIAELSRRQVCCPPHPKPRQDPAAARCQHEQLSAQSTGLEIGAALALSPTAAVDKVMCARVLVEDRPDTWAALRAGRLDPWRAQIISVELIGRDPEVAARVEAAVLAKADGLTPGRLRALITKTLLKLDPEGAKDREKRARAHRSFGFDPAPDGMSRLSATMGAASGVVCRQAIDGVAHGIRQANPDDPRTLDQLRVDALEAICRGVLDAGHTGCHTHPGSCRSPHPHPECDHPTGGHPAGQTTRQTTEQATKETTAGSTDEVVDEAAGAATAEAADAPVNDRPVDNPPEGSTPIPIALGRRNRPAIMVTVSVATLLGMSNDPGVLAGYGPISADLAREISAEGTWQRLLTDPATGAVLEYGRTRYRPPAALADLVLARDPTCRFMTCAMPSWRSDIDHCQAWEDGGHTGASNNAAANRRCHIVKHAAGWKVLQDATGHQTWISPTGKVYDNPPPEVGPIEIHPDTGDLHDDEPPPF